MQHVTDDARQADVYALSHPECSAIMHIID